MARSCLFFFSHLLTFPSQTSMSTCIFAITNEDWRTPVGSGKKNICIESQFQSGFIFFEASDWWSRSIIQKIVKVVIQYEDSKLKIYYPPAVSEFSSMSCHKDVPCTNVSVGNTCCSDSCSLALCIASSMLLTVRLMVSYGEPPFLQG